MKKVVFLLLAVLMISTIFLGCDKNLASALASKEKHIALTPDEINVKVGETIEVTAKITDGKDQIVTVDHSKFQWSVVTGAEAIDIAPTGNTVKITAKKTLVGNAMIKITHPEALTHIQRVVHITKGENSGNTNNEGNTGNTGNEGSNTGIIAEEDKGDIFFRIGSSAIFDPSPVWTTIKEGDSITIDASIKKSESSLPLEVDNSKFEWSITEGKNLIKIEPDGNVIKITAIKKEDGAIPTIKVTHPYAKKEGIYMLTITLE